MAEGEQSKEIGSVTPPEMGGGRVSDAIGEQSGVGSVQEVMGLMNNGQTQETTPMAPPQRLNADPTLGRFGQERPTNDAEVSGMTGEKGELKFTPEQQQAYMDQLRDALKTRNIVAAEAMAQLDPGQFGGIWDFIKSKIVRENAGPTKIPGIEPNSQIPLSQAERQVRPPGPQFTTSTYFAREGDASITGPSTPQPERPAGPLPPTPPAGGPGPGAGGK